MDKQFDKVCLQLKEMMSNLKFGSITLVIQDGKVIQIEKSEKVRIK